MRAALWLFILGCGQDAGGHSTATQRSLARTGLTIQQTEGTPDAARMYATEHADVLGVVVRGEPRAYTMGVLVRSPDTGCERYAAWWEVLGADGALRYRRILEHSHVEEQPFSRSGGPVEVDPDEELWIRAWLHPTGYGGRVMRGSVRGGFVEAKVPEGFGAGVAPPQLPPCSF